jgi:hypothetical protein
MISRSALRLSARFVLAALLFAQGALALAACDWMRRAPSLAVAQTGQPAPEAECPMRERNVNLCVAHCLGEDQSLDKPSIDIPALAAAPVIAQHSIALAPHHSVRLADLAPPAIGPPPRIRFQTLLL